MTKRPARRTRRFVAGALVAALAALLTLQVYTYRVSGGRAVGALYEETAEGLRVVAVDAGAPADRGGLEPGDLLESIDGQPIGDFAAYDAAAERFRRPRLAAFRVLRDGTVWELWLEPGVEFPWSLFLIGALAAAGYLAVALLVILQGAADSRARLLLVLCLALALELAMPQGLVGYPRLELFLWALLYLLTGLQFGVELHLALLIPRPRTWLEKRPWLPLPLYLSGIGFGTLTAGSYLAEELAEVTPPWSSAQLEFAMFQFGFPLWAVLLVAVLLAPALRHPQAEGRHQASLVLLGVLPWAVLVLAGAAREALGAPAPEWGMLLETLALLFYPAAVLVAIHRYRLFRLELSLSPQLIHSTLTGALLVSLLGTLWALGATLLGRLAVEVPTLAVVGAALLTGLLFTPARIRLQELVDRAFFPERITQRRQLGRLARELPALGTLPAMGDRLVAELCRIFHLRSAVLLLADPQTGLLGHVASRGSPLDDPSRSLLLSGRDALLESLRDGARPRSLDRLATTGGKAERHLRGLDVDLLVPVVGHDELIGLLLLGEKELGQSYSAEERELLGLLAHHLSTVFENLRLFESATRDSLTRLLRREAILNRLTGEMQRAQRFGRPLAVGMADLDHFKAVNDLHGHLTGDLVLREVARALAGGLRRTDVVGRYGGEEFLILLPETTLGDAFHVADKLRRLVEAISVPREGRAPASVTISIGLAALDCVPGGAESSPAELITQADQALYQAKRLGRNRVEPAMAEAVG